MTFDRPVLFLQFPGEDSAYLVLQQSGAMVRVVWRDGAWAKSRFDSVYVTGINGIVNPRGPGEGTPAGTDNDGGLLGFAFHPRYAENRRYYICYVDPVFPGGTMYPGTIVLAERRADSTLRAGSGLPQRVLLALRKPYIYHNGGTLKFGRDGFLYTAVGDGGGSGDPQNRAQNKGVLFGKFLRLDVDGPDAFPADTARDYAVPPGNPFADSAGFLPEIWAYGLRSPWKWDFHPVTNEIWLGDIGQSRYEEVTRVPRGANLGWKIREGAFCYPSGSDCAAAGLTPPVFTFPTRNYGNSVTGGVFFTGDTTAAFHGLYIYGDFGRGRVWAMRESNGIMVDTALLGTVLNVASLDKDARGRVFAVSMTSSSSWSNVTGNNGVIYVLESPDMRPAPEPVSVQGPGRAPDRRRLSRPILFSELMAHRHRYIVTGLDGRKIERIPTGAFLVREIGADGPARLMVRVPR